MSFLKFAIFLSAIFVITSCSSSDKKNSKSGDEQVLNYGEADLLTGTRQLIFEGRRAGEGYFSADGKYLIYQAEVSEKNPFYQIYGLDFESGETWQISPGHGKTTCAWIHPNNKKAMFASTHSDPKARQKQKDELEFRQSGKQRRYSWDYDENYDIYESRFKKGRGGFRYRNLTKVKGYDAEGSYSPDGKYIAFASNRHGYTEKLSPEDSERFSKDPSYMLDIYIMRADGSNVKRLTTHKGYDGGPFFSPDGKRIVWRRFAADGHTAEVYTMNIDGTDQKQITTINAMSWAPYYHPSGDYIIFTTNKLGYRNFELYIVDANGKKSPKRVTFTEGFDGLPVFSPDGRQLVWSRQMSGAKSAHMFVADWDDKKARALLDLPPAGPAVAALKPEIQASEIQQFVEYFAAPEMRGRMTGSDEEAIYMGRIARYFESFGMQPIKGQNSLVVPFEYEAGGKLIEDENSFMANGEKLELNDDYRPLTFSKVGSFSAEQLAFAGYGIKAPAGEGFKEYNSFQGLDVKGKWVLMFRFLPDSFEGKQRVYYQRYSRLRFKVKTAAEMGAKGVIFVSGPKSKVKSELVNWSRDAAAGVDVPVLSVTDDVAEDLIAKATSDSLGDLQEKLNKMESVKLPVVSLRLEAKVSIETERKKALNVIGVLKTRRSRNAIMLGAHGDHLGDGKMMLSSSRATKDMNETIHFGADDNASGMSAVLELAHYFSKQKKRKHNLYFAIWSGEEMGTLGSSDYVKKHLKKNPLKAYINLDMIGRFNKQLQVQGTGSARQWAKLIQKTGLKTKTPITVQQDPYLPTDSTPFYLSEVPTLSLFTGTHGDYHTPLDTPEKLNFQGIADTARFAAGLVDQLGTRSSKLSYVKLERQQSSGMRRTFRIYLGTMPDYAAKVTGLRLSGVIKGGPADKSGLQKDDIIVEFAGKPIKGIYDYMYALEMLKPGEAQTIKVKRSGKTVSLSIVPESKQ